MYNEREQGLAGRPGWFSPPAGQAEKYTGRSALKIKAFEFNLRELAGSMGDFGTLFPLAVGYITVCGMDPTGLLLMMGLANIVTGIVYRLPMPIEPMKVLAVMAIAQRWTPAQIAASGFAMGLVWLIFALTGVMDGIARLTPQSVIRGVQLALGLLLARQALPLLSSGWLLALLAMGVIIWLRNNPYAPAALVLMGLALAVMFFRGDLTDLQLPALTWPRFTPFKLQDIWFSLYNGGFSQIPLTAANAVLATAILIRRYFPDRPVSERQLSLNMGIMNLFAPLLGGMPMCHGAGGLAGQYFYGARTGGANILEGLIEMTLGLFFAGSVVILFNAFPRAILGAMLLLVGLELIKFVRKLKLDAELLPLVVTAGVALAGNMALGFAAGLGVAWLQKWHQRRQSAF
jgi:MFS superfamily sulfate permease-like transporter